jgi:predicted enzyme related to lactoylglutathione lyase
MKNHKMNKFLLPVIFFLLTLYSCSPKLPEVPPINKIPTSETHPGKFIWHDLMCQDIPSVKKFYTELFGWTYMDLENSDNEYAIVLHDNKPIAGIFKLKDSNRSEHYSQWINYLSVDNMTAAINYVKENGGSIYRETFQLPHRGVVSFVFDSQHAVLALVKSSSGDPKDGEPIYNQWLWTELWTNDVDNSLKFYTDLFGYKNRTFQTRSDNKYYVLQKDGRPRAGIVKIPFENVKPNWLPYIAVKDPSEIVEKVKQLGGKVYLSTKGIVGNNAAIIADPSGAVFAVQKWPLEKGEFKEIKE